MNDFINDFATTAADNGDPFFIYCPLIDPHSPFVTPPGYSGLSGNKQKHQAMVEYLDLMVGRTLEMVRNHPNMVDNTLVIFTCDNGTNTGITTQFNGASYQGGKAGTFDPGTHVGAVAWGMKGQEQGAVSDDLADLTADELRFVMLEERGDHTIDNLAQMDTTVVAKLLATSWIEPEDAEAMIMGARDHWFAADDQVAAAAQPAEQDQLEAEAPAGE